MSKENPEKKEPNNTQEEMFGTKIIPRTIVSEMEESYLDYAMSVIVARALPDVRDGLKPVQRRILYSMLKLGLRPTAKFRKSAQIVGETMGKYHPHGDNSIYEAMVNMAQDFSQRYPMVRPQGNFGSMDGDPAAAQRYTEAKMAPIAEELIQDLDKETVDFRDNYDGSIQEPTVLPSKLPNLLLNGALGIAVGMATKIPPHNISEVMDATILLIDNPESTVEDIMEIIKGPDFPTGGIIYNKKQILDAYRKGRGGIVVRGVARIEEGKNGRSMIIISEIPYRQNKATLVQKIAELVKEKILEGVADIRDESSREGVRIVVELTRNASANKILNQLFHLTPLQQNFNLNIIALEDGLQPRRFNVREILLAFIAHRRVVIVRRLEYELRENKKEAHILEGLKIALDNLDAVISLIRNSTDRDEAKECLMREFSLTEVQADAILNMRLSKLAALERQKIIDTLKEILERITWIESVLASDEKIMHEVRTEVIQTKETYADDRKTKVVPTPIGEFKPEDFVEEEDVLVTMTESGYIKRMSASLYKTQHRGGKGVIGMSVKDEDSVTHLIETNTHDMLLFFANTGRVFSMPTYEVPEGSRIAKGLPIRNFLQLESNEHVTSLFQRSQMEKYVFFVTEEGIMKKVETEEFSSIRSSGLIAIKFKEDSDRLVRVLTTSGENDIFVTTKQGQAIRFDEEDVRSMGRTAMGVIGIRLRKNDRVISADAIEKEDSGLVFALAENGIGKKTKLSEFSPQNRGGVGVRAIKITKKTGNLSVVKILPEDHSDLEMIIVSELGVIMRSTFKKISTLSRQAQGVIVMRMKRDDRVVACEVIGKGEEEEGEE